MNTRDLEALTNRDEKRLAQEVARFVRAFHRLPNGQELAELRRAQSNRLLSLADQVRRAIAGRIAAK